MKCKITTFLAISQHIIIALPALKALFMLIFRKASELSSHIDILKSKGLKIGFVPTMGALHEGHLALVDRAALENDEVVVSIFVNPTQFNNANDLERYPRTEPEDLDKLKTTGCTMVFLPSVDEIYPDNVSSEKFELGHLDTIMEGLHRPGHFQGVATVVKRFFDIIKPHKAYFGKKDYQQLLVIKKVAERSEVEVIGHGIERNNSGLALSSRNALLSEKEKEEALIIYQNMLWAKREVKNNSPEQIKKTIENNFKDSPLSLEYVEIVNAKDLLPISRWEEARHARIFMAAYCGEVRLIDNLSLF